MYPEHTIDENSRQVGLGYAPDITVNEQPLLVNGSDELLIEVIPTASLGTITTGHIEIDENSRQVAAAVNDSTEDIVPLTVTDIGAPSAVSCLRVDIL